MKNIHIQTRVTNRGLFIKAEGRQPIEIPMPKELAQYLSALIVRDQLPTFPIKKGD